MAKYRLWIKSYGGIHFTYYIVQQNKTRLQYMSFWKKLFSGKKEKPSPESHFDNDRNESNELNLTTISGLEGLVKSIKKFLKQKINTTIQTKPIK